MPTTREEGKVLGWDRFDIILVTGDAYFDSPFFGVALVGKILCRAGFRVGILPQPDTDTDRDITRLGEPALFWGITGGAMDSLVANRTAAKKRRRQCDLTPGGRNDRRPDRAVIVYANLIRRAFGQAKPLVLGGLEASLRRVAHYDFWTDRIRRSILFDARADWLLYGMADETVVALARGLAERRDVRDLRGLCFIHPERPADAVELSSFAHAAADPEAFRRMVLSFYAHSDPLTARRLCQQTDTRFLVQNPPPLPLAREALDAVYGLPFARDVHPRHRQDGAVRARETIRFSLTTHRGCYGACRFCSIPVHQGRTVTWRSEASLLREAAELAALPDFRGNILDVGGPTANMYGFECKRKQTRGACPDRRCLDAKVCPLLGVRHDRQRALLEKLRRVPGVKRVFVASGIRHDLVVADRRHGEAYLRDLVRHHVSGQLKVAPEHTAPHVLRLMGKPGIEALRAFKARFDQACRDAGKRQFLTYYFMAAHPGCTAADMERLRAFAFRELRLHPEQVQIFTPTPSTLSTLMYHTGRHPDTGAPLFVERNPRRREGQKAVLFRPQKSIIKRKA